MPRENHPAVRNRKKKRLAKIESCVHAQGEPQASRAFYRETPEQAHERHTRRASPAFPRVRKMDGSEEKREQHSCRPKADALGQSVKRVAAEEEFLEQGHHHEKKPPVEPPFDNRNSVSGQTSEGIASKESN